MAKKKDSISLSDIKPMGEDSVKEGKSAGKEKQELTAAEKRTGKMLIGGLAGVVVLAIVVGGILSYKFYFKDYFEEKRLAAQKTAAAEGAEINITEDLYVSWINEIYTNQEKYLGQTVAIEGMYKSETYENNPQEYYFVYRTGPGCCGNDGTTCGFELLDPQNPPEQNDWVQVVGTLDRYEENGNYFLYLRNPTMTVDNEHRGAETVKQ